MSRKPARRPSKVPNSANILRVQGSPSTDKLSQRSHLETISAKKYSQPFQKISTHRSSPFSKLKRHTVSSLCSSQFFLYSSREPIFEKLNTSLPRRESNFSQLENDHSPKTPWRHSFTKGTYEDGEETVVSQNSGEWGGKATRKLQKRKCSLRKAVNGGKVVHLNRYRPRGLSEA